MSIPLDTSEMQATVVQFSYEGIDEETVRLCQDTEQIARTYGVFTRRTVEKGYELGCNLNEIKERLKYGQFMPYVESIGVPQQVANYWMRKVKAQQEILDIYNLPQIEEEKEKERTPKLGLSSLFPDAGDDDEPNDENDHRNGLHEPTLERVVPGVVTSPEAHTPVQSGNGHISTTHRYDQLDFLPDRVWTLHEWQQMTMKQKILAMAAIPTHVAPGPYGTVMVYKGPLDDEGKPVMWWLASYVEGEYVGTLLGESYQFALQEGIIQRKNEP